MIRKERILITGAAGFIGSNLVRKLVSLNNYVYIFVKKTTNLWRLVDIKDHISIINTELEDRKNLETIISRIKPLVIFHLAAHGSYPSQLNQIEMIKTNLIGTANLLLALNKIKYRAFINTGSSSEYGFKKHPMKESNILSPESFYAATKGATSYFSTVYARVYNKPIITLRPFSVYGEYEEPSRLIPTVIMNSLKGKDINLTPQIAKRDFIYIDDMVNAYIISCRKILTNPKLLGEVFNIGTGREFSNEEIVKLVFRLLRKKVHVNRGGYQNRSWDSQNWLADISKANKLLKWKPKYSLEKGLEKTIKWFKKYGQFHTQYN